MFTTLLLITYPYIFESMGIRAKRISWPQMIGALFILSMGLILGLCATYLYEPREYWGATKIVNVFDYLPNNALVFLVAPDYAILAVLVLVFGLAFSNPSVGTIVFLAFSIYIVKQLYWGRILRD
jgi:hypothetical protein